MKRSPINKVILDELNDLHFALQVADGMLTLYFKDSHERKVVHETRLKWHKVDEARRAL